MSSLDQIPRAEPWHCFLLLGNLEDIFDQKQNHVEPSAIIVSQNVPKTEKQSGTIDLFVLTSDTHQRYNGKNHESRAFQSGLSQPTRLLWSIGRWLTQGE